MALAHTIPDAVEKAYRRGDLFDKRRKLMDAWAEFCGKPTASGRVVSIVGRRGGDDLAKAKILLAWAARVYGPDEEAVPLRARDGILIGISAIRKADPPARGRGAGPAGGGGPEAEGGSAPAAAASTDNADRPNLILWNYKDPRLQSAQQVQENAARRSATCPCIGSPSTGSSGWPTTTCGK